MRIKKLELVGFKSFKDRTVILFDAGITGIVGPNGCGKSNIVDALVWVMGEMSAKHLRGSSMEDVIFAGSDGYAPIGMAEVSLTLENDGGPFPAKYLSHSEVMITRRLHRSGDSEYLINKQPARLRDIQEIFMDTGAGSKGFSIIEQGAIGKIITAKPEDRRVLIEEAAGITKFKVRKRESQRKLQATDQNLIRLNDIVIELKRQLDSLHRQAQRAERYKKLKDQAQDIDLWLSSSQYTELKDTVEEAQKIFDEAQGNEFEGAAELDQCQARLEELQTELATRENAVNDQQVLNADLQNTVQSLDRLVTELRFKIEQGEKNEEMTGGLVEEQKKRQELLVQEETRLSEQLETIETQATEFSQQFNEQNESLQESEKRIAEIDEELSEKRQLLLDLAQKQSHDKAKLSSLDDQKLEVEERFEADQALLTELRDNEAALAKRRTQLTNDLEGEKQLRFDIVKNVESFEGYRANLQGQIDEKRAEVDTFKDNLNEVASRLYGLENLHSNFEGFQEGVKNVMFWQKKRQEMHADGTVSEVSEFQPVSEVVEVQEGFDVAMEAALGNQLQTLVGEDSPKALEAVSYLKEQNTGRSSFLAGDVTKPAEISANAPSGEGVMALLKDVVRVPERYESAIPLLFDGVAVVENLTTALELRPNHPGWSFVTPEGDTLSSSGIMTGGAAESADSGVLKRRREIKELAQKKDEWAGKLSLAQMALKKLEAQMVSLESDLTEAREKNNQKEIVLAELKKDLERAENEWQTCREALTRQEESSSKLNEQLLQIEQNNTELQEALTINEEQQLNAEREKSELETELLARKNGIGELQEEVSQLKAETAAKTQEAEGYRRQLSMVQNSLEDIRSQISKMDDESEKNTQALSANQIMIQEKKIELESKMAEVEEANEKLSVLRDHYEQGLAETRDIEKRVNEGLQEKNQLQSKMNDAQLKLDQAKIKEQYLIEQIEERYMLHLPHIVEQYKDREGDKEAAATELEDLKKKLSRIGEVNLSAIEDYSETEERYKFLSQQQEDLVEAKEQLRKVIDRINRICSKRFKETFEAVNERFTKVFPVLFGGGEARLLLLEDEEKGEMGIDIVAKPPGKKMTSVSLMSGGEKALTAVSLIFSIFLVKPSPFCLLDEVDAPLDDANVSRFNDLVKEMAKRSQIIIVTHNKYTMAVNKKLYGVTMEERGVSKMVSVSLEDAQTMTE